MASVRVLFHRSHLNPRTELFAESLAKDGHDVSALCWGRGGSSNAAGGTVPSTQIGSPGFSASMLNIAFLPLVFIRFFRAIRADSPDLLLCAHVSLLPLAAALRIFSGTAVVYDVVDPRIEDYSERDGLLAPVLSLIVKHIERLCLHTVDGITVIDTADDVVKARYQGFTENLAVVYNLPRVKPRPGHDDTVDLIVYAGVLDERKGVMALLNAFSTLHGSNPDAEILFIGDSVDDTADRLRKRATELGVRGAVKFAGQVEYASVHEELSRADVAVAPYQPVPMNRIIRWNARKIPDYMNAALPVIGPDFGGIPEIIEETKCGLTADTTDIDELAAAIDEMLNDSTVARRYGDNGRAAIESQYNWEREQTKLLSVVERALAD